MQLFDHRDYVSMTMEFRCNLRCVHCMIEGTMDRLVPESGERFEELLAHNAAHRRWKGLILTGSEITLLRDLPDLARRARAAGFAHVRIQTHGMHLAQPDYCESLIEAGIDEYFVSLTAPDAATHDAITTVPGSFDKTLQGLENLDRFPGVVTLTNTVVTNRSFRLLPAVVDRLPTASARADGAPSLLADERERREGLIASIPISCPSARGDRCARRSDAPWR